jgi:serine/threonine protein kinase
VLAAPDGQVKVIDFAIAARRPGLVGRLFGGSGPARGTPSYMAPEQIRGQAVDARADIYSLGCVLFELLTGKVPYTAANPNELLNKHVSAPIPAADALNKNATTAITKLLRQMLGKKPAERPKSMKDVLQQIRTIRFFERMHSVG